MKQLLVLWSSRYIFFELVKRDLKLKYRKSVLGYFWSLLTPLMMMLVVSTVFSTMFKTTIENFPIYLLAGQIIFTFFSESTTQAMTSIVGSGDLIKKIYLPKYIFPIAKVTSSFISLLFSLMAIVIMLLITQTSIKISILFFPVVLFYVYLIAIGIGLILSVMTVFFRDLVHLYGVLLSVLMYMTPIFYPLEILPEETKKIISLNPLYHCIEAFRTILLKGTLPSLETNMICLGYGLLFLCIGLIALKKHQDKFVLRI